MLSGRQDAKGRTLKVLILSLMVFASACSEGDGRQGASVMQKKVEAGPVDETEARLTGGCGLPAGAEWRDMVMLGGSMSLMDFNRLLRPGLERRGGTRCLRLHLARLLGDEPALVVDLVERFALSGGSDGPRAGAALLAISAGFYVAAALELAAVDVDSQLERLVKTLRQCAHRSYWLDVLPSFSWTQEWATIGSRSCLHGLSADTPPTKRALADALADQEVWGSLSPVHRTHFQRVLDRGQ